MTFISIKPKISFRKRKRSKNGKEALQRLNSFLSNNQKEPVKILCGFWEDQKNAISYQELRMAVLEGYLDEKVFDQWAQDYSYMVTTQFEPIWTGAIKAGSLGQPIIDPVADKFSFDINSPGITEWIHNRGSFLVTNCTDTQKDAINYLLDAKIREQYDPGELARMIRPCIGLTKGQTSAAKKIYDNTLEEQRKAHPRTKDSVLQQRALEKATKYAERAHRQRATTITQTELAFAYNHGADQTVRQAQEHYLIGKCIKRWNTAGDDNVCPICESLDGTEVGMEETYNDGNKVGETVMMPPLHPRCACAIEYIEVEPPNFGYTGVPRSWGVIENMEEAEDLSYVNPEYHRGYIPISELKEYPYNTNCVNCVVTTDLRMRGHDVTACSMKECDLRQKSDLIWTGSDARKQVVVNDPDAIINAVKNSENGARFFIGIDENNSTLSGHAVMAMNVDGRFELLDPQVAARYNEAKARNRLSGVVKYFRIDDLELEQRAYTAAKKRVKK